MFVGTFEFEEGGRLYRCCVQGEQSARTGVWWWFDVSGDAQRYAPFHPEPGDTKSSVRARIVSYYNALLTRRAMPPAPHHPGRRSGRPVTISTTSQTVADPSVPDGAAKSSEATGEVSDV